MELHIKRIKIEDDSTVVDVEKELETLREENPDFWIRRQGLDYTDNYAVISYSKTKKEDKPKSPRVRPSSFGF